MYFPSTKTYFARDCAQHLFHNVIFQCISIIFFSTFALISVQTYKQVLYMERNDSTQLSLSHSSLSFILLPNFILPPPCPIFSHFVRRMLSKTGSTAATTIGRATARASARVIKEKPAKDLNSTATMPNRTRRHSARRIMPNAGSRKNVSNTTRYGPKTELRRRAGFYQQERQMITVVQQSTRAGENVFRNATLMTNPKYTRGSGSMAGTIGAKTNGARASNRNKYTRHHVTTLNAPTHGKKRGPRVETTTRHQQQAASDWTHARPSLHFTFFRFPPRNPFARLF